MHVDPQSLDLASSLAANLPNCNSGAREAQPRGEILLPRTPRAALQREGRAPYPHAAHAQPLPAQEERLSAKEPRRSPGLQRR